ncbi:MAG: hypothetical protein SAL07_13025 [Oscillatoria sp. PMC 1051.18]|nr:hypothetical protein [Oscillatoria sp. PMC 1050.18]MEC5030814.1 hypothetical protein [Oscillatoria sp. PMC 1051.18]
MLTRDSQSKLGKFFSRFENPKTAKKPKDRPQIKLQVCVVTKREISEFRRGEKQALQLG